MSNSEPLANPVNQKPPGRFTLIARRLTRLASSRYTLAVCAQGLVSGFHFVLNLVLLRLVTPYDYGVFAFAFVLALFGSAINNALIATPLTVYTPVITDDAEREDQERLFSTLNLLMFVGLLCLGLLVLVGFSDQDEAAVGVAVFVACYAARHYSRSTGYARLRPLIPACGDLSYVISGASLIILLILNSNTLEIGDVLLALALANGIAMLVERLALHGWRHSWRPSTRLRGYGAIWEQARWALAGSMTTLFVAQAHTLIITGTVGPDAYAPLAAGFVLFGPVRIALLTWQNMVKPELAVALSENRTADVRAEVRKTSILMGLAVVALGIGLALGWPWLHGFLYAENYGDQPMAMIVAGWSMVTFFAALYNAPSAALQAMRQFRALAIASVFAALISGLGVTALLLTSGPSSTVFGVLAAEGFMAIYLIRLLLRRLASGPSANPLSV